MENLRGHWVAIIGGACAGSTAAAQFAAQGIHVAVFEQQALPFGKIEDGLPKWHIKLRDKEEAKIVQRLNHSKILYVPGTRLGKDIDFIELAKSWGFSAVLLASGAWRDRPLPVDSIDNWIDRGFYYQNTFVEWFNHSHEPQYNGPVCHAVDDALVIGGGLASIDVVKILMLETVHSALQEKNIAVDIISLEHKGIAAFLEEKNLSLNDLGLKGCTLCYRRRAIDMPLANIPPGADEKRIEKVYQVRQKILQNAMNKYLFKFRECCLPSKAIISDDRLSGLQFRQTQVINGKVEVIANSEFDFLSPLVISSIGSIPQQLSGIPSRGELFALSDWDAGKVEGFPHVFALGNAVTGRGNIRESELHAKKIASDVMTTYLNWKPQDAADLLQLTDNDLQEKQIPTDKDGQRILDKIRQVQAKVGYNGQLTEWVDKHRPLRLENMIS